MNLLALCIFIKIPLGLVWGGRGHWNVSGMFSTGRACVQDLFWKYAFAFRLSDHDSTRNIMQPHKAVMGQIILIQCGIPYVFLCK